MKFNTIGVIAKPQAESARQTLQTLFEFLKHKKCNVIVDDHLPDTINTDSFVKASREEIGERCDLAIVVGGDGTILNAVRSLSHAHVPIVGINVGRLGFLADISPDNLEHSLDEILKGSYSEEQRFLLEMQVVRDNEVIFEGDAFNDVVIHIRDVARMIEFETRINDEFVNHQRADGIVISTPTGSTAYALSAGGPILHATLDAITLVPISPHTLSSRPLVIDADSLIDVMVCNTKEGIAQATCDGHLSMDVHVGDHIKVKRKAENITLLHPKKHNYFEILRAKLHWSEHS
ncbi:MAG: NAD(+) kinase [Gammaproteobacteria bacterium]|nr:NAD(+) kinase [Gammaproteobacteria bacterium]NNJ50540.1 NAD(+) kinase [Gammaproteobacteria bacterium]